jgi:spore germination protein KC
MKRVRFLSILIVFLLSGCWDKMELNDVSIVTGIAVEKGEKAKYKLTISAINSPELSKTGALGNTANTTFSQEGNSVSELAKKMNVAISRRLIYSHTRVLIIDRKIAEEGILGFIDYLERSGEFRNDFNILISDGAKASDVLKMTFPVQRDPSLKIHTQIDSIIADWGGDPNVRLSDFILAMTEKGNNPVCTVVGIKGNPDKGKTVDNNKKDELDAIVFIKGMAIFNLDQLIGIVPIEDTRNYLWTQDLKKTNITVQCGKDERGNTLYNDLQVLTSASNMSARYHNGSVDLHVKVSGEAKLVGTQCKNELSKLKTYQMYKDGMNKYIETSIRDTIQMVQKEYKTDVFGFGEYLNRKQHKTFVEISDDWDQYFTAADITVKSNVFLRRTGVRTDSFITEVEKEKAKKRE